MNTPSEQLLESIRITLFDSGVDPDVIRMVESSVSIAVSRYDIKEREQSLVVYDDEDEVTIKKFFISKAVQGCTQNSLKTYRLALLKALGAIQKHLKDITSDDIRMYLAQLTVKGLSSSYLALNYRTLSSFFGWCYKNEIIQPNPILKVERIKVHVRPEEALTPEQMEQVRSFARTKRDKAFVEMLYSTGCRVSELCSLNRTDIDWEKMEAQVLGKGKKYRTVYITQRAKYAYLEYDRIRKDKSVALFGWDPEWREVTNRLARTFSEYKGVNIEPEQERMSVDSARSMLRGIGKKMGIRIHPHLIRKTTATQAMTRGMPIDEVRIMLGHESIATTTIYAQTLKDNIKESHEKFV